MPDTVRTTEIILHVHKTPSEMAEHTAQLLLLLCKEAIEQRGICTIALSGGKTPLPLFNLLASPKWRNAFPWECLSFYWVDEHCVPIEHPSSNYSIAKKAFLSHTSATRFYRIRGELSSHDAMTAYNNLLINHFSIKNNELPRFDIIMLGVGITGYVASLYPNSPALSLQEQMTTEVFIEGEKHSRITLTMPVINNARYVIFMASGKEKSPVLSKALNILAPPSIPPQLVRPTHGKLIWNVDEAATQYSNE
ncbi:MAG: 6-phosphogluconolactonase [Desulfovibrionaceae bacterium]